MSELVDSYGSDESALGEALTVLSLISLENGAADIRAGLRTLENHRTLALDAFRQHGLEGFALVTLYGPVLEALGGALPLDQALILLRVNSDYVDELLRTHRPETVAGHLSHVAAAGLVEAAGGARRPSAWPSSSASWESELSRRQDPTRQTSSSTISPIRSSATGRRPHSPSTVRWPW